MKETTNLFEIFCEDKAEMTIKNLKAKLMVSAIRYIREQEWDAQEAATQLGRPIKRIKDLLNGRMDRFSIEGLLEIVVALNIEVEADITYLQKIDVMIL
jgi:predicted XRE-type DNA-binding protein